jgi:hypothetical protein
MLLYTLLLLTGLGAQQPIVTGPGGPPSSKSPGVLSLKEARAQGPGATVTVRGVVLNGAELGSLRFIQDSGGGLALYAPPARVPGFDGLRAGDSLQVTGQLKNQDGLLEIDPVASVHKISSGQPLRALRVPAAKLTSAFVEANESRLLEITGLACLTTPKGTPVATLAPNTSYLLNGLPSAQLSASRTSTGDNGVVGTTMTQGESFDVRGLLIQSAPSGKGGYQLLPRLATDFVSVSRVPRIPGEPVPVSITSQGLTIEFTTLYPGDTRVNFGPSATELAEERTDAALTTRHRVVLDALEPGTTYYVQVSSQNGAGTVSAPPVPFITGGKHRKRHRSKGPTANVSGVWLHKLL